MKRNSKIYFTVNNGQNTVWVMATIDLWFKDMNDIGTNRVVDGNNHR